MLDRDSRRPAADLARDLGVSRATVQNRIDKLKARGTIARFTIELGREAETSLVDALVMVMLAPGDSRKIVARLKNMPEIETLTSVNGTYDLVLELRVASLQQLDRCLRDIRRMPMVADTNSSIRLNRFK